jgi:organic hydroperoxide reductase OsmC/OhrA
VKQHSYDVQVQWTGNLGEGTKTYSSYRRDHAIICEGKPSIQGSSDPDFRGDGARYNPEELLVASLSSCHMLWYLHLCSVNQIAVLAYRDFACGTMQENDDGSGQFIEVTLKPLVKVCSADDSAKALALHDEAHRLCFISRSVNFVVSVEAGVERA